MSDGRTNPCADGVIAATPRAGDCAARAKPWVLAASIAAALLASFRVQMLVAAALAMLGSFCAALIIAGEKKP